MLTFDRIMLASDFSASSEAALHYAAALARRSHARLLILHVMDTRVAALPHWSDVFRSTEVFAAREAEAAQALERLSTHPALAGLSVETSVQHGNPTTRICDLAPNVDLVVMGTRGRASGWGIKPYAVAQQVAHGSIVPVLLVPESGGRVGLPAAAKAEHLTLPRVVLALHFAHYAPQAIDLARALAVASQAPLQVLQVLEPDKIASYPLEAGSGLYHNREAIKTLIKKRLADIVPDSPTGPTVERLILEGEAAETIVKHGATQQAGMIVMSVHAYGALQKFFIPSTVDAVIAQAPCPLLAVPFPRPTLPFTTAGSGSASAG
jgi:nucleotide-binding universal stress UspA family protein